MERLEQAADSVPVYVRADGQSIAKGSMTAGLGLRRDGKSSAYGQVVGWKHESDEYTTPQHLFNFLDDLFHFTLDVAASTRNTKCAEYYDKALDALAQDWQ